jgi:hypothetical protein
MQEILGIAIGIATVCLLLSIIASHLQEVISAYGARRAATLEVAIQNMLSDPKIYGKFFAHPLIQTISFPSPKLLGFGPKRNDKQLPTYIASTLFTRVLKGVLAEAHGIDAADFPTLVARMPDGPLKVRLQTLIFGVEHDAMVCNSIIEQWYDGTMERINGLYKRYTQWWLLVIGLVLAIGCNANMFNITERLWKSQAARDEVNAVAQMYACKDPKNCDASDYADYRTARSQVESGLNRLPLGYANGQIHNYWASFIVTRPDPKNPAKTDSSLNITWPPLRAAIVNFLGWMLTGIAVSLGAPFWFDAVNKLINLRMNGDKPPVAEPLQKPDPSTVNVIAPQGDPSVVNMVTTDATQMGPTG